MKIYKILFIIILGLFTAGAISASIGQYWTTIDSIIPRTDDAVDIGSTTKGVRHGYFNDITANKFYGDGSNITNVPTLTISGKAEENIAMGQVVYVSGATGGNVTFGLSDNTVAAKTDVVGIAAETKTTGQTIKIRINGQLENWDTSAWSEGDGLYLSTAGAMATTTPTSGTILHVADVEYSHASQGDVLVHIRRLRDKGAPASTDLFTRLGDSAGSNKISYKDYADNEVASIDSDGNITSVASFIIGSASMDETDLEKLDGITNGTAAANKALVLDASLDIATINSLTATTLVGALTGNADTATLATTVTVEDESADTTCFLGYFTGATGSLGAKTGTNLTFNSNTGMLTATGFTGPLTGTSSDVSCSECLILGTEVKAGTLTDTKLCTWDTGNTQIVCDTAAGAGDLLADGSVPMTADFNLDGNNIDNGGVIFLKEQADADADIAGQGQIWVNTATPNELWFTDDAGTDVQLGAAGAVPTQITVADESADTTCFMGFFTAASGDLEPKTGTNVTFNSNTGILTATGFAGDITGALTGNADTVTGYTPASGTLTLAGADAITITTTAATGVTLPTSGTIYGTLADSISSANLLSSLSDETGTGVAVFATSPTFTTGITVPANSISDDEINEGDTFEWTAAHTWTGALTVGVNDTGHDVIFYGASTGRLFQWDESADELIIDGASEFGDQTNKVIISNAGVLTFGGTADIDLPDDSVDAADINTINCGTNCTWDAANDEIDIDDAFITDGASDVMTGTLTADGLTLGANENITLGSQTLDHDGTDFVFNDTVTITGDSGGVDDPSVPMVLYNTDDTPPAASGFPIGTIYIKYTP